MSTKPRPKLEAIAVSSFTTGSITKRFLNNVGGNQCSPSNVLDVAGTATTDADGKAAFTLRNKLCPSGALFRHPVVFLATPISTVATHLTVTRELVGDGDDVAVSVYSWDANGAAAPKVRFDWRCNLPVEWIID